MGYLEHYDLPLRKHKGIYRSLCISHQYTEGPRNSVVLADLIRGMGLIPSCQLAGGLQWIQFSTSITHCLFQCHFQLLIHGTDLLGIQEHCSLCLHQSVCFQRVREWLRCCSASPAAQYFPFFVTRAVPLLLRCSCFRCLYFRHINIHYQNFEDFHVARWKPFIMI